MATIIVVTDFSASALNALEYASGFSASSNVIELLLLNISAVPSSYSGDGVAMAAISDTLQNGIDKLQEQVQWVQDNHPILRIRYKALIGNFLESLQELIEEEQAVLVIMGTPAAYGEIWSWSADILAALTALPIPVLTVPQEVPFKPIRHIAFASIPGNIQADSPMAAIKKLVQYTGAKLHVIMVTLQLQDAEKEKAAEASLRAQLQEVDTEYHKIYESHIVQAIGRFVEAQHIDLLLVRPRKHGVWYNLFHKSYTRELAKLNLIPVMALHDEWNVN